MIKSASTRAIITALQGFEAQYGVGSVTSIGTVCSGDRTVEYILHVKDAEGREVSLEIPSMKEKDILKK